MSCESELLLLQTQMSEGRCMYASPLIALPSGACCERFLPPAPQGTQCSCCRHSSLPHPACQVTRCPWFAFQSHVADLTLHLLLLLLQGLCAVSVAFASASHLVREGLLAASCHANSLPNCVTRMLLHLQQLPACCRYCHVQQLFKQCLPLCCLTWNAMLRYV